MKKLIAMLVIFAGFLSHSFAVDMPAAGGSALVCANTFRDPGGAGNYGNNISSIYTLCPSTAGNRLQIAFTSFNIETNDDLLYIYDGGSISAPLIGVYTGVASPGTITASTAGGCLTFRFISDNNGSNAGWTANTSCLASCQSITANFLSSTPAPNGSSIIQACQGQSISFSGGGTFGTSGVGATYQWSFGDGTTASGTTVNHSYAAGGAYTVNLTITDAVGCKNANFINRTVQISTTPTIVTSATPSPLCTNQFSHLAAAVTMQANVNNCAVPVAGTTFLPDISGGRYHTSIPVSCYTPGTTVTAASNIVSVCLNMEHTYVGDLSIILRCPNGQQMDFLTGPSFTGSNLGNPVLTDGTGPGTGFNYCFTPPATTLLLAGTVTGGSIVAGNYRPVDPFTDMIGCPLNGNWEIEIQDNLGSDDGYIFSWGITFDPAILPANQSFTPTIVSQGWVPQTYLYNGTATDADVVAATTGTHTFTYSVTDNFGCTYTQTQNVVVNCTSLPAGLVSFDAKALSDERVALRWITESEHNTDHFEIDRSTDGENWEFITAAEAAGDSENELIYSSMDSEPATGVSYYRLRTIDNNGTEQVSDVDVVTINAGEGRLVIYPNPATDALIIEGNEADLESFRIINTLGQDVRNLIEVNSENPSKVQLDISSLAKGTYTIKAGVTSYLVVKK